MSRRTLALFLAVGVIWGTPYFFIKIGLEHLAPHELVFGRCAVAAIALLPIAFRRGAIRPALTLWPYLVAFALLEMAGPWWLLSHAEQRISSGFAGLFMATIPLLGVIIAAILGEKDALGGRRLFGIGMGLAGVTMLVGLDTLGGHVDLLSVIELTFVAIGYAVAPVIAARAMSRVPAVGVIALSLAIVALLYAPIAVPTLISGGPVPLSAIGAVLALGVVCSAVAFMLFFALIAEVGPARATVVTFINPAVAVLLGAAVLKEPLTAGTLAGFPLVLLGSWLATHRPTSPEDELVRDLVDAHGGGALVAEAEATR
jgi:drug/metabolite transporter (DMT)-like permease